MVDPPCNVERSTARGADLSLQEFRPRRAIDRCPLGDCACLLCYREMAMTPTLGTRGSQPRVWAQSFAGISHPS